MLLVSHDRDFLDRVATVTVALEGEGRAVSYAGGWSDMVAQRGESQAQVAPKAKSKPAASAPKPIEKPSKPSLSFTEKHRLEELPAIIERLEAEIGKLSELLSDPQIYISEPVKAQKATDALAERQAKLDAAETEWMELEEKAG